MGNKTHEVNETIASLELLLKDVNSLMKCNNTQIAYQNVSNMACGSFTTYLMESFFMMEILSGLSFLFLMTFFYALHRLGINIPEEGEFQYSRLGTRVNDSEISMKSGGKDLPRARRTTSSTTTSKYYSTNYGGQPMTKTENKECGSIGCLIYTILIFAFWGAISFAAIIVSLAGNTMDQIQRI